MPRLVTLQATFAATLVDEWARAGVRDAVVAPGSRSTPLALALAADDRVRVHVHLDERAAGFFAVGIGLATGRPAVVLTTSGTAAVELHPAVVEASQARVPLIACTADRPVELQDVGAPQTVRQARLFGDAVRWFVEPGAADAVPAGAWRSLASRLALEAASGPVHANLAFRDPLVGEPGPLPEGRPGGRPWHAAPAPPASPPAGHAHGALVAGRRGVVVAGWGATPAVAAWAGALGWPVLADPRSRCRGAAASVAAFDSLLRVPSFVAGHEPEVVVRVGAPPASKVLSQWLAALPAAVDQVVVDPAPVAGTWPEPEQRAAVRLAALPEAGEPAPAGWLASWLAAERAAQRALDDALGSRPEGPTEPGVVRALTRDLPPETTLFVSSSMPIRTVEWFGHPSSTHRVLANRGANGIDGVVATALGVAAASAGPVVALVGDLAFLYDSSALVWAARRGVDLTVVVLDNDGGGIFSFLPQRDELPAARFEALFGTPHGVDVGALAAVHGIPVVERVGDGAGLRLMHVRTDRDATVALHRELHAAVAAAVAP